MLVNGVLLTLQHYYTGLININVNHLFTAMPLLDMSCVLKLVLSDMDGQC